MGNAEQTPLAGDVVFAAEQKLPKPPTLFDLPKYRFNDLFS